MNKKIVASSLLLLMLFAVTASVFAENSNYQVVVVYETRGVRSRSGGEYISRPQKKQVTVTVTASSPGDAEVKAKDLVQAQENPGKILSANAVEIR